MSWRETNSCKSPSASEMRHQKMYKMGTPPWKETYRKKCKERLMEGRRSLLEQMRMGCSARDLLASSVEQVLTSEFDNLKTSHLHQQPSLQTPSPPGEESMDELLEMLDEVKRELMLEEREALKGCMGEEKWVKVEGDGGVWDEWMDESPSVSQEFEGVHKSITCPICLKNSLTASHSVVHCPCGLRVDTQQDAITLEMIEKTLKQCSDDHSNNCPHPPSFTSFQQQSVNNLLMSCKNCDYLYIII